MFARRIFLAALLLLPFGLIARASRDSRPIFKSPLGLAVGARGELAYVALHTADALAVVDVKEGRVLHEIPVGRKPYDVVLHKGMAYVTCEADDTVVAVDLAARKVKSVHHVGQAPRGISVDQHGVLQVVCHDNQALWTLYPLKNTSKREPIRPQPEGNYARAGNLELVLSGGSAAYRHTSLPHGLFTKGQSIHNPRPPQSPPGQPSATLAGRPAAFHPPTDLDPSSTSMDMVAHTRPRWFTPTERAPEGRVFTNAFSFFLNGSTPAAVVLLDEPDKGYPDPTDVVVKLPAKTAGLKTIPLPASAKADDHPLKDARVFISSGGADAIVVLDLHKAAKHFETHRGFPPMGGFNGSLGGGQQIGGWGGGFNFGGGNFGQPGGFNFGGGFGNQGQPILGPAPANTTGDTSGGGMAPPAGMPPGGPPASSPPAAGVPPSGSPPGNGPRPGPAPRPQPGGPLQPGRFNLGGGGFNGGFGGFGGGFGWNGSFGGGFQGGSFLIEDLGASANYTLARLPTQANPRRMALTPDGKTLIVSNHLADSLTLIDANKLTVLKHISLEGPTPDAARRGEILFHSAAQTFHRQFTCASCHPNLGSDGLSWDTTPKGPGEPLNSRALRGVRDTAPFGWRGESETFEQRAHNTMKEVHKHTLADSDAADLAAFLETIEPPRPLPQHDKEQPAITRGQELFHGKGQCSRCHRGPAYQSQTPRAVIATQKGDLQEFDVPSLCGVARTAPYLHDGRALTLEDIFLKHNPLRRHGQAHELTPREVSDLVAFLKTL